MNTQEQALDWPSADESWIGIKAGSGSNPSSEKDRPSASRSPADETTPNRRYILIVEDNPADVLLIRRAIKAANLEVDLQVATDGEQAIRLFDEADNHPAAPCPDLVILDINLPKKPGGEVLYHMRQSRRSCHALVIVVSTSASARDRETMLELGANGYFRKPSEYAEFMKLGDMIKDVLGEQHAL
jgi:two-component system, chemotaxis family, response regulator Rcp1